MKKQTFAAIAFSAAAGLLAAAPAHSIALAEYTQVGGASLISWTHNASGGTLATLALPHGHTFNTYFTFQNPSLASVVNVDALFTLSGSSTSAASFNAVTGDDTQPGIGGSFSFIYEGSGPLVVGSHSYAPGTLLLGGTYSNAEIVGPDQGHTASAQDPTLLGGTLTFTTGIDPSQLAFAQTGNAYTLTLGSLLNALHIQGSSLASFKATSTGSFQADLTTGGGGGTPEPATWALMLLGVGGIGFVARRRAKVAATA